MGRPGKRVQYEVDREDCWIITSHHRKCGYPSIQRSGKILRSNRWAWEQAFDPVPAGMCVLHRCDNPLCINPQHLFLGTQLQNIRDRNTKERQSHGERHPSAKLTENEAQEIRRTYIPGKRGNIKELVAKYYVHRSIIQLIGKGKIWKGSEKKGTALDAIKATGQIRTPWALFRLSPDDSPTLAEVNARRGHGEGSRS